MSKIIFKQISWKNLLSTGNSLTTLDLDKVDTTLIVGENGSGKSTLLDAIIFALYGKAYRNINKPQIVNSINRKDCLVELDFSVENVEYKVIRGIKSDVFELYRSGELLNQDASAKDYQKVLEQQILKGLDHKAFLQTAILGSASYVPFMELKAAQRGEIVEDILDIKIFSIMKQVLKEQIVETKAKEVFIDAEILKLRSDVGSKKEHLASLKEMSEKNTKVFEDNIETSQQQITILQQQVQQKVDSIPPVQQRLNSKIEEVTAKEGETTSKEADVVSKEADVANKEGEIANKERDINNTISQLRSEINVLESDKTRNTSSLKFYEDNDDCPTCHQPIAKDFKDNTITKVNEDNAALDVNITAIQSQITDHQSSLSELEVEKQSMVDTKNEIKDLRSQLSSIYNEVSNLKSQKNEIENELTAINNERNNLESQIKVHQDTIEQNKQSIEKTKSGDLSHIKSVEDEIQRLCEEGLEKSKEKDGILNKRGLETIATKILKDDGIKTTIIHEYLPLLNQRINEYLVKFDSYIAFNIDESFNESVKSRHRDNFSYANFSEGEKLRIDIALLMAFRDIARMKNSVSTNLLIMDEVFDASLDAQGADFLMEIISLMQNVNVIVISHRADQLLDKFSRVITFKKVSDFSVLVDE